MAWVPLAAGIASSVIGAGGALSAGQDAAHAAEINAQVQTNNANAARDAAKAVAVDIRRDTQRSLGTIRANAAASGVIIDEGSPLEVLVDSAGEGELAALRAIHKGEVEGANFDAQAALDAFQARSARSQSYYKAGATLLGGFSKGYSLLSGGAGTGSGYVARVGGVSKTASG